MKKVLITGIAQGLGKFCVDKLESEGYIVGGIDRFDFEEIDQLTRSKLSHYWKIDLSDIGDLSRSSKQVFLEFQPDILINNAAIRYFANFEDMDIKDITNIMNVNYVAPVLLTKEWLNCKPPDLELSVVFISSNSAYYGYLTGALYCSTKSALRIFAQALMYENKKGNLNVITLCPESFHRTGVTKSSRMAFSIEDIYKHLFNAINAHKSFEISIIRWKTKLHNSYHGLKQIARWLKW